MIQVFILQMTERPGFDRFLIRLKYWGIHYEIYDVSEEGYDMADITTPREVFKLFRMTRNSMR